MIPDRIYADFQNLDDHGRVRLTTVGSRRDLSARPPLSVGEIIGLYTDDVGDDGRPDPLLAEGRVELSNGEWVAVVDWSKVRTASELALELKNAS